MVKEKNTEQVIVGVDHGFQLMKHAHGVFPNGLSASRARRH